MATFKDMEDSLKSFIIQEQSDAHNAKSVNNAKYNNIKVWMDTSKYIQPHFFIRISISLQQVAKQRSLDLLLNLCTAIIYPL